MPSIALRSHDEAICFLAVRQSRPNAREGLLFFRRHVRPDIRPPLRHGSTVCVNLSSSAVLTISIDMYTLPTRSKAPIYCLSGSTAIRSGPGIISYSICATMSTYSISSLSGSCHLIPLYLRHAIVYPMGHLQAPLLHGATASSSTIRRK